MPARIGRPWPQTVLQDINPDPDTAIPRLINYRFLTLLYSPPASDQLCGRWVQLWIVGFA